MFCRSYDPEQMAHGLDGLDTDFAVRTSLSNGYFIWVDQTLPPCAGLTTPHIFYMNFYHFVSVVVKNTCSSVHKVAKKKCGVVRPAHGGKVAHTAILHPTTSSCRSVPAALAAEDAGHKWPFPDGLKTVLPFCAQLPQVAKRISPPPFGRI